MKRYESFSISLSDTKRVKPLMNNNGVKKLCEKILMRTIKQSITGLIDLTLSDVVCFSTSSLHCKYIK